MYLAELLQSVIALVPEMDKKFSRLVLDSRQIKPGDVFIALRGVHMDGRQYIDKAIAGGAVAILVDADTSEITFKQSIPLISIPNLKTKVGELAAVFYEYPARKMRMIGVTGTNGKTSCTHFIAQVLQSVGESCGIIGTLGSGFYGQLGSAGLTTPDPITLQAQLANFQKEGAKVVAMEVSSHSIDQGRINGIPFEIGIFTNLTQDHLDYHGDMETYAQVKRSFIAGPSTKHVVINADDAYGEKWITELAMHKSVYAYSLEKPSAPIPHVVYVYATNVELSLRGMKARLISPWGEGELFVPLIGKFNLSNILAVITTLCIYGIPFQTILKHIQQIVSVPGRMQMINLPEKPLAVVDYAHTPDALEKVLQALRLHTKGKLICVFGCGGDRDQGKRPLMAKIAEELADQIIVTNDNPRHEDPEAIAKQIQAGFSHPERVTTLLDRSKAIENSIQLATANDCILIAGKGAEHYQQIGDEKFPFDDVEITQNLLKRYS